MDIGIQPHVITEIISVLKHFPKISDVVLYGSRAMGRFRPGSDIDLAIYGSGLEFRDKLDLSIALEDLDYPYSFDITIYDMIKNDALKNHIDEKGILIYSSKVSLKQ
jgi:uncharacterized protein